MLDCGSGSDSDPSHCLLRRMATERKIYLHLQQCIAWHTIQSSISTPELQRALCPAPPMSPPLCSRLLPAADGVGTRNLIGLAADDMQVAGRRGGGCVVAYLCSRQVHSRDGDAAVRSSGSIVTVQSKLLTMHFSREFMCDCAAATFAAIACTYIAAATCCYC